MREMDQAEREHWRELMYRRKRPEDILWMQEHAIVTKTIETPYGTVCTCANFILVSTPEELAERKRSLLRVASRLAADLADRDAPPSAGTQKTALPPDATREEGEARSVTSIDR